MQSIQERKRLERCVNGHVYDDVETKLITTRTGRSFRQCVPCRRASKRGLGRSPEERAVDYFLAKVDMRRGMFGCWIWTSYTNPISGYGQTSAGSRFATTGAHRRAYVLGIGPIPTGLHIDHLCRVRACVNPLHLEAVTQAENSRRAAKTVCRRGHEFAPENVYITTTGFRRCRTCMRMGRTERAEKL